MGVRRRFPHRSPSKGRVGADCFFVSPGRANEVRRRRRQENCACGGQVARKENSARSVASPRSVGQGRRVDRRLPSGKGAGGVGKIGVSGSVRADGPHGDDVGRLERLPLVRGRDVAIFFVRGYQRFISPYLGGHCRFYPTCSQYAIQAFEKHGLCKGFLLGAWRILRCGPWHPGGLDPVPDEVKLGKLFRGR